MVFGIFFALFSFSMKIWKKITKINFEDFLTSARESFYELTKEKAVIPLRMVFFSKIQINICFWTQFFLSRLWFFSNLEPNSISALFCGVPLHIHDVELSLMEFSKHTRTKKKNTKVIPPKSKFIQPNLTSIFSFSMQENSPTFSP